MANGDHGNHPADGPSIDPTGSSTSTSTSHTTTSSHGPTTTPPRPSGHHQDQHAQPDSQGVAWGWVLLSLLLLILIGFVAWTLYARWRARRLGAPPPSMNPFSDRNRVSNSASRSGGLVGWVQDKIAGFSRQRTAGGAYEGTTGPAGRRGRGMDPDEAWDTRVGNEADVYGVPGDTRGDYYEEQELSGLRGGIHDGHDESAYAGGGYGRAAPGYGPPGSLDEIELGEERGRTTELDKRYEEETGNRSQNPFEDQAEPSNISLRGVSPRPHEDSPTERRSMFKENV